MRTLLVLLAISFSLHAQTTCPAAIGSDVDRDGVDDFCDDSYQSPLTPPTPNPGYGPKRILVAHFKFPDEPPPFAIEETRKRLVDAQPFSVAQFFEEISYGATRQTYDIRPWVDLPQTRETYQTFDPRGSQLIGNALEYVGAHYDLANVDVVFLIVAPLNFGFPGQYAHLPPGVPVGDSGMTLPVAVLTLSPSFGDFAGGAAHELGHTYGFSHTSSLVCRTWPYTVPPTLTDPYYSELPCGVVPGRADASVTTYAFYDVMGNLAGHPNAFLKSQAGWLKPGQLIDAPTTGSFVIDGYETASDGPKAIRIPYGADAYGDPVSYWIEYRAKPIVDLERQAVKTPTDRVAIWLNLANVRDSPSATSYSFETNDTPNPQQPHGMRLPAGGVFTDPYRGIRVQRGTDHGDHTTILVETSLLRFDPSLGVRIGPNDLREIRITNSGDAAITIGPVQLKGRNPAVFQIASNTCSGVALRKGSECRVVVAHKRTVNSGDTFYAQVELTTDDPLWPTPTIGLIGQATKAAQMPQAPAVDNAVAGDGSVSVFFTPRASGDGTLQHYTATCTGGMPSSGTSSPIVVRGLANGVAARCVVNATTTIGDSAWSAPSAPVTPLPARRRSARS